MRVVDMVVGLASGESVFHTRETNGDHIIRLSSGQTLRMSPEDALALAEALDRRTHAACVHWLRMNGLHHVADRLAAAEESETYTLTKAREEVQELRGRLDIAAAQRGILARDREREAKAESPGTVVEVSGLRQQVNGWRDGEWHIHRNLPGHVAISRVDADPEQTQTVWMSTKADQFTVLRGLAAVVAGETPAQAAENVMDEVVKALDLPASWLNLERSALIARLRDRVTATVGGE